MTRHLIFLTLLVCAFSKSGAGDLREGSTEISLGLGATFPKETNPLNVPGEMPMSNSLALSFGARRYVGDMGAVGIRIFGTVNKLSDYSVVATNGTPPSITEFTITTYTVALEGLVYLSERKTAKPYLLLDIAYSGGLLTNKDFGSLPYRGFTAGGGAGLRFRLSETVALSIEAIAAFGGAKWKSLPFKNSSDDHYNPSTIVALADFSFLIN